LDAVKVMYNTTSIVILAVQYNQYYEKMTRIFAELAYTMRVNEKCDV